MSLLDLQKIAMDAALAEFGESCTINGAPAIGSFRSEHIAVDSTGVDISANVVTLVVSVDTPATVGHAVVIRSNTYTITDIQADGNGGKTLFLAA